MNIPVSPRGQRYMLHIVPFCGSPLFFSTAPLQRLTLLQNSSQVEVVVAVVVVGR